MKTDPLLQTCTLGVGYGKKQILSHVDLCFFAGEFVCLLGPNGAGKTPCSAPFPATLLRLRER